VSANSGSLLLGKGIKVIRSSELQPIVYFYNAPDFSRYYIPMGFLYCLLSRFYKYGPKGERAFYATVSAVKFTVGTIRPYFVKYTTQMESEIETPYPQFTWIPPSPFDMFSELSYEIRVTEILAGQTALEAIQYNTPRYTTNLTNTFASLSVCIRKTGYG
jgi:hypothetical protein